MPNYRAIGIVGLVAVAAFVVVAVDAASHRSNRSGAPEAPAQLPPGIAGRPAPRIRLQDAATGRAFDTRTLRGRPYAVTFLYTECPDVCPIIGDELAGALSQLGPQGSRVAAVAISVDPAHDSVQAVRAWLRRHREPRQFHYLVGSQARLEPVWKSYFAAPQIPGDPNSSHTAAIWFVDRRGRRRAEFTAGSAVAPSQLVREYRELLGEA